MSDAGEGLVDAEARLQERMEERAAEKRSAAARHGIDPDRERARESLRLARAELSRQAEATASPVRLEQIKQALAEIDRRLAAT
jgi:hypothetical protein